MICDNDWWLMNCRKCWMLQVTWRLWKLEGAHGSTRGRAILQPQKSLNVRLDCLWMLIAFLIEFLFSNHQAYSPLVWFLPPFSSCHISLQIYYLEVFFNVNFPLLHAAILSDIMGSTGKWEDYYILGWKLSNMSWHLLWLRKWVKVSSIFKNYP